MASIVGDLANADVIARAVRASDGVINTAEADDGELLKQDGEATFLEIAESIGRSLSPSGATSSWSLEDAVAEVGGVARVALSTNCRVRATNARRLLGWAPDGPTLSGILVPAA